jgi:hypothetical protein
MGFPKPRVYRALQATGSRSVQEALDWMALREGDPAIDAPLPVTAEFAGDGKLVLGQGGNKAGGGQQSAAGGGATAADIARARELEEAATDAALVRAGVIQPRREEDAVELKKKRDAALREGRERREREKKETDRIKDRIEQDRREREIKAQRARQGLRVCVL